MSYQPPRPVRGLLLTPEDPDAPERVSRLRRLGLGDLPEPALDAFAEHLARLMETPYAIVNFVAVERQFFAGVCTPNTMPDDGDPWGGRVMPRDHGFCPHVVLRRRALALEDVNDYPRFACNPVVDIYGVRSYLGAPMLDSADRPLGTLAVADMVPRIWGRPGLETVKAMAAELAVRLEHGTWGERAML